MRKSIDGAIFVAAITAILYTWSTAFYHGYYSQIGLDADILERNFHRIIYDGMVISFYPIFQLILIITLIFFLYSHYFIPFYIYYVRRGWKAKKRAVKLRKFWRGSANEPQIEIRAKSNFNKIGVVAIISMVFVFSLLYFDEKGREQADVTIDEHLSLTSHRKIIQSVIFGKEKSLTFLACGSRNCAGIETGTNRIYYFSESLGYSFIYKPKKPKASSKTNGVRHD